MLIFLRNIPDDTTHKEIFEFIIPALKRTIFRAAGEIKSIKIMAMKDNGLELVENHAVVHIEPDSMGLRSIKKLHGKSFKGKRLTVREYHKRSHRTDCGFTNIARRRNLEVLDINTRHYTKSKLIR